MKRFLTTLFAALALLWLAVELCDFFGISVRGAGLTGLLLVLLLAIVFAVADCAIDAVRIILDRLDKIEKSTRNGP